MRGALCGGNTVKELVSLDRWAYMRGVSCGGNTVVELVSLNRRPYTRGACAVGLLLRSWSP